MDMEAEAQELFEYLCIFFKSPAKKMQDVSQGEMATLAYLMAIKQEATPTELSNYLNISTARIANTLNSLEKKKYIKRIHDSVDRRKVIVHITELGEQTAETKHKEIIKNLSNLLQDLGNEDSKDLLRLMKKINLLLQEDLKKKE